MTLDVQHLQDGIHLEPSAIVSPRSHKASDAIGNAIIAANHRQNGVVYEPFQIKVVPGTDFHNIWNSWRGTYPITFFQYQGSGPFLPLGDLALNTGSEGAGTLPTYKDGGVMLFAPSAAHPDALAHPTGFQKILDDQGSDNPRLLHYYWMIAPDGYAPLGIAFSNGNTPDPNHYWCVKKSYLRRIGSTGLWSDDGTHFKTTGDLWRPVFDNPPAAPDGKMLLIPPTCFRQSDIAWAIEMDTADLEVADTPTPDPVYDRQTIDGRRTDLGVTSVKVMPFSAVADASYANRGLNSPFYYVAAEPFWYCSEVLDTRKGGKRTRTVTIGVEKTESETFRQKTSMTVSAKVGASFEGLGAEVSTSFTKEWELTTVESATQSAVVQTEEEVNYPEDPQMEVWQHHTQITVYRTDLSQLPSIEYANRTLRFLTKDPAMS